VIICFLGCILLNFFFSFSFCLNFPPPNLHDLITFLLVDKCLSTHEKVQKFEWGEEPWKWVGLFNSRKSNTHTCRHPFARFDYNNLYNVKNKNMHSTLQISSKLFLISRHDPPLLTIFVMQKTKTCIPPKTTHIFQIILSNFQTHLNLFDF
jgi:hypothetical protein